MRVRPILFSSLAVLVLSGPAVAQNLAQNRGFATDLSSWTAYASAAPDPVGAGTGVWDAQDVDALATSGSAHIQFAAAPTGANAAYGLSQCIDLASVQPVTSAVFGTRFKLPTSQVVSGGANVTIDVAFFSAAGCAGTLITGGSQGKTVLPADLSNTVWSSSDIALPGFDIQPLASPLSAQLRLVVRRVGSNSNTLDVFFDSSYFAVNGTTSVELLTWEVE
ncbi:MAG: hypothetical protein ABIT01_14760 [Thermoanaerobaculia bacterium]